MDVLREVYGKRLAELGEVYPDLVVLDADLSKSTRTALFAKRFPQRFFDMGIAEADMVAAATGMALGGLRVVASSFAIFVSGRAWEQVRNSLAHNEAGVTLVATHGGITVGPDGASHQALEDIALMRAVPGMLVAVPGDAVETRLCLEKAIGQRRPGYIRLPRGGAEALPGEVGIDGDSGLPMPRLLAEGADVLLVSTGIMGGACLAAVALLAETGIRAGLLHCPMVKPFPEKTLRGIWEASRPAVISVEEHSVIGGLGDAVALALHGCPAVMQRIGTADVFGESGEADALLEKYGLSAAGIAATVRGF
jgi:transketolase